jgi:hypothetical protein
LMYSDEDVWFDEYCKGKMIDIIVEATTRF